MAKENNLYDLMKNIGDAIRIKKGITGEINPQDFGNEIVNIANTNNIDLTEIGYTKEVSNDFNKYYTNGLNYAKQIAINWVAGESYVNRHISDNKLVYFPQVDFSKAKNCTNMIYNCANIEIFPNFTDNNNIKNLNSFLHACPRVRKVGNIYKVSDIYRLCSNVGQLESVGIIDLLDCTNTTQAFYYAPILKTIYYKNYKKGNLSIAGMSSITNECINYIIENAVGVEGGAEQRTLTLEATAKKRWQDPNQNPQYEYYAAMAAEKIITIA